MSQFPLTEQLPRPDATVTPQVKRLVEELRQYNQHLVPLSMKLPSHRGLSELAAHDDDALSAMRLAGMVLIEAAQIARRLDLQAAETLERMAKDIHTSSRPSQVIHEGMSVMAGVMKATLIDGPAKDGGTIHVSAMAASRAEASAEVALDFRLEFEALIHAAGAAGVPDEVVADLGALQEAVEREEAKAGLLARFGRIAEGLKPYAELLTQLTKLAGSIFSS